MARTVTQCNKCQSEQVTETLLTTIQTKETRCGCCGRVRVDRPYDEYDLLSEKYGVTRALVLTIESFAARKSTFESLQGFIVERLKVTNSVSNGYTPLTVHCHDCHSTFRFHTHTPTQFTGPKHCVYCGSSRINSAQDNELDYWEVLANAYGVSIELIKMLYTGFTNQRSVSHFADYVKLLQSQFAGVNNAS
jgi:hypothetical protein